MGDILRLEGVSKFFADKAALDEISISVADNEYVTFLGPSGSGKTTLLRVIAGFERPDRGSVIFEGKPIDDVPAHLRGIGFVFQNFALFPHLSVFDNIAFGLANRVQAPERDAARIRAKAMAIIELVGLGGLEERGVHQISGGQRQRVALARTLVTEPRLVLLDEPLGALDANLRLRMRSELRHIRSQLGVTFLHVTGSETEALAMGDRVAVLDSGRIAQLADPDTVYNRPVSPNVARFLNCYNLFDGTIEGSSFVTRAGRFPFASMPTAAGRPGYAVRRDRINILPDAAGTAAMGASVSARFLASEYSGATVNFFFEIDGGQVLEVEHHLSHRLPEMLEPHAVYRLAWRPEDGIAFS
jgi:putative spermidine/putrescine transport system ATP-binding protein